MSKGNFYITTPIYYVNDKPHIGHAYTTIACDVLARFMHLDGYDVKFTTGTDEHGQKVDKAAKAKGVNPQDFTDEVSKTFRRLVNANDKNADNGGEGENLLNISNDDFIRTTEQRHKKAAQELWRRIEDNGFIYKDNYGGWYAVRDEAYYQENELIEKDGEKVAPTGAEVEWVEEESYFFKLSAFQQKLLDFYDKHPDFIQPESRYNEVVSFVRGGKEFEEGALKDLSISRTTFDWGVDVPDDDNHIMYVWIDALCNYMTSAGFPDDMDKYTKYWGEIKDGEITQGKAVHFVGKDILRFHAVYWPAFLMAAELPLPQKIVAHGWWTIEGEKMSKSIGNVISPDDLVENYGLDQVRYFMLRAMPFGNDGDFSRDRLAEVVNADLANNIGNLAQRVLSMIQKNCEGKVPDGKLVIDEIFAIISFYEAPDGSRETEKVYYTEIFNRFSIAMRTANYYSALNDLCLLGGCANSYIDYHAPWTLKKEGNLEKMSVVLYSLAEAIRRISIMLQPFCPDAAGKILDQLSVPEKERMFKHLTEKYALKSGTKLPKPEGVFPRIDVS